MMSAISDLMDIVKTTQAKPFYKKYWYVFVASAAFLAFVLFANRYRNVSYIVFADELLMDTVVAGDLSVTVSGYGQLKSRDVVWIGADTEGRVSKILANPGDLVHQGDVLVELANPQLLQDLKDAELEYAAKKADTLAEQIAAESILLDLQTEAANAELDYQTAKIDLDAKTELMSNGLEIISRLDYESTQLSVQKYEQRWEMQKQRVTKRRESMLANRDAEQARLLQAENELQKIRDLVEALSIKADVNGIVQEMDLELGQRILRGQDITRIARPDRLVAEIQIQELLVNDIGIGMKAEVDTRSNIISGTVSRIDPTVEDGSVMVEIELLGQLPPEVRPELNVEAEISVAHIPETLYVKRPVFARAFAHNSVYKLNEDGDIADRISVEYGQASTNHIEVLSGALPGDELIISDSSAWSTHDRVLIR
ncbi:MAG: efflux RND transporter periplasmic adaptor subunit [Pseudomonadales bacterium]|nr:efflux RND transporter periplasmic adaptor subunit [Pseudomonadales bacterium]